MKANEVQLVDLHIHSTASDGTCTPSELIAMALDSGLSAIAITDHDTVDGVQEALSLAQQTGLEVIPGIEISAASSSSQLHILGYYIDHKNQALLDALSWMRTQRATRNPKILSKLQDLGIPVTEDQVSRIAGSAVQGRPHIAQAMMEIGAVKTLEEAFDLYLGKDKPAYIPKSKINPLEAINLIRGAGGIPVVAHPLFLERDGIHLDPFIGELCDTGLGGIEVWYSDHSEDDTTRYAAIAEKYNLIITGGSDYHGTRKPGVELGIGYGSLRIPYSIVQNLKKATSNAR